MHKRIEIVIRNPGFEKTENALGAYTLDFESEPHFNAAISGLKFALAGTAKVLSVFITNERGDTLAVNPEYYISLRASDVSEWQPPWLLPGQGALPPPREEEA